MTESMTCRERWMASVRCQALDRLPFWPKLDGAYPGNQRAPFRSMDNAAIHRFIGSDVHHFGPACVRAVHKVTSVETAQKEAFRKTLFRGTKGTLTYVERFDKPSCSFHPIEFPVKTRADIAVLTEVMRDTTYEFDPDQYAKAVALVQSVGEDGITAASLGISPLMDWLQHLAGIENGHYFLNDYPDDVEGLFAAMHAGLVRRTEIMAAKVPYPIIYSTENTSTTLISPNMFKRYCYPHLEQIGRIITAAGKIHILHMCGKLKKLLPDIGTLPASGIEAFTSPPVGNASLLDGRTDAPSMCFIGGTNATDWMEPAEAIIRAIQHDLDALPHHRGVVVTSGGVMPPHCRPETIKAVADWVKAYGVRV